ncbi:MFS transporter [Streptomyces galbus]|uniref:MFS transporter n=1 Tax=Streptomyces galbus TaxID=33898 RepID=A0ABX1ITI5_STRGB|nr:MFS transporter [Streptomyces galbus]NKQ27533.1 MFS transporter [Streptomyces galbus]
MRGEPAPPRRAFLPPFPPDRELVVDSALQRDLGLTPLRCALVGLPLPAVLIAAAPAGAVLLRRGGARRTTAPGGGVLALGVLVLARAPGPAAFAAGFALVGAGFGTVMVTATHVVVRQSPVPSAGVAGGLQQTAVNTGPVLGVAAATVLMDLGDARTPVAVLALGAAAALPLARALPGPSGPVVAGPVGRPRATPPAETIPPRRSLRHDDV